MRVQYVCIMGLLLACALLAYCVPHGADLLKTSALRAFESHIALTSYRLVEDDEEAPQPAHVVGAARVSSQKAAATATKTSTASQRKRITPFLSKKVAARQKFRCALCGEFLTEDWEVDHITPLHVRFATEGKIENRLEDLQALRKRCHMLKNSMEQSRR